MKNDKPPTSSTAKIAARLRSLWRIKLLGAVACTGGFLILYFASQRLGWREPVRVPATWVDIRIVVVDPTDRAVVGGAGGRDRALSIGVWVDVRGGVSDFFYGRWMHRGRA